MTQSILPPVRAAHPPKEEQLADLAQRYKSARGIGMQMLGLLGGFADNLVDRLPGPVADQLESATEAALDLSFSAAAQTRGGRIPDTGTWLTRAVTAGTGAAGGFGGLPTAMAELPLTTTVILRALQGIAAEHGFDPDAPDTRADCMAVFAAAGPLSKDDNTDLSFLTLRVGVTGVTVQKLMSSVAPKLAAVLGQKLAAQTVPILGAVTGAAINYAFTSYYQELAHVQFGLRKLAEETGHDRAALIAEFEALVEA